MGGGEGVWGWGGSVGVGEEGVWRWGASVGVGRECGGGEGVWRNKNVPPPACSAEILSICFGGEVGTLYPLGEGGNIPWFLPPDKTLCTCTMSMTNLTSVLCTCIYIC